MAGGFPPCLAGRRLVDWFGLIDWQCLADYWLLGRYRLKIVWFVCTDWLTAWLAAPSLLSWSAVGWLVWAERLGNVWLTIGWWETVDSKMDLSLRLTDCMAGGFPPCLAGRRLVDWFGLIDWQCLADYWLVGDRRLKNGLVFTDWLTAWLAASLLA